MARKDDEKMFGTNLPREWVDDFWAKAAPEGTSNKLVLVKMAELWLSLSDHEKREMLYPCEGDTPLKALITSISQKTIFETIPTVLKNAGIENLDNLFDDLDINDALNFAASGKQKRNRRVRGKGG